VTYARVSSIDQRERQTILTQTEELNKRLRDDSRFDVVDHYVDDGITGMKSMGTRPDGKRLLDDARRGRFDEVWMFKVDRMGRDGVDPFLVRRELKAAGVKLVALQENIETDLEFGLRVLFAAEERTSFLARSAAGMARHARQGHYCGGIVAYGYRVEGKKPQVYLVPSDRVVWGELTEADVVRRIYKRLALDRLSCRRIADEFNALGIPTSYQKDGILVTVSNDGRGVRKQATQGKWRPGRIRNLVINPVYRGELQYGRRSSLPGGREVISANVPPLVSQETWKAAQDALQFHRLIPKNPGRTYLLRSVVRCALCGLNFCGTPDRDHTRYRCDGQIYVRGPLEGRCPSKSIKGDDIEIPVWNDIERYLRDPGSLLDELGAEQHIDSSEAVAEAESIALRGRLAELDAYMGRAKELFLMGHCDATELDQRLANINEQRGQVEQLLATLTPMAPCDTAVIPSDILDELRRQLELGLTIQERQEIVRLLVRRIVVHTELRDGKKHVRIVAEYRFPAVVPTSTGTGSSRTTAGSWPET